MKTHSFDLLIAVDKNLPYQQNLRSLPVSIIKLDVKRNVLANLLPFLDRISELIEQPFLDKKVFVLQN